MESKKFISENQKAPNFESFLSMSMIHEESKEESISINKHEEGFQNFNEQIQSKIL